MIFGCFKFTRFLGATGLVLAVLLSATAQQPPSKRGRPIQFSEPRSDVVSSNINQLRAKQTSLKDLEQDLKKPFELLSPGDDPANRLSTPPPRPALPSAAKARQLKELLEKRNEWIFLEPEDYYGLGLTAEEMLNVPEYGPNGEVKQKKTPLERYYDNLDKTRAAEQAAATNRARGDGMSGLRPTDEGPEGFNEPSFASQSGLLKAETGETERAFESRSPGEFSTFSPTTSEASQTRGFSDLFGFGRNELTELGMEKNRSMQARSQEFKQLLEMRSGSPLNSGAAPLNSLIGPSFVAPPPLAPGGLGALPGAGSAGSSPFSRNPGSLSPTPVQPGVAANSGLPNWQTTIPTPEPPRKALPPPTFQIPQRKF